MNHEKYIGKDWDFVSNKFDSLGLRYRVIVIDSFQYVSNDYDEDRYNVYIDRDGYIKDIQKG